VKALCLEARGKGGLDQKSAHDIVRGPNHALCLAILWGSLRTRHTGEKEGARGGVIELTTVVALDGLNGETELSGHPGKEVKKGGEGVRLGMQREGPGVVRKIINDHPIILIARNVEYRRSPQITVDKIKSVRSMRRRRKRRPNMTTKLASQMKLGGCLGIISCVFLQPWKGGYIVSYTWASMGCTQAIWATHTYIH
jgi:hypothetical protein